MRSELLLLLTLGALAWAEKPVIPEARVGAVEVMPFNQRGGASKPVPAEVPLDPFHCAE